MKKVARSARTTRKQWGRNPRNRLEGLEKGKNE